MQETFTPTIKSKGAIWFIFVTIFIDVMGAGDHYTGYPKVTRAIRTCG